MSAYSAKENLKISIPEDNLPKKDSIATLPLIIGAGTAAMGALGIIGLYSGITLLSSIFPGYKPIAFSAALAWIVLGILLLVHAVKPLEGIARTGAEAVLAGMAVIGALGFLMTLAGVISSSISGRSGLPTRSFYNPRPPSLRLQPS